MSDVSQGPGWWQASDGKWYPPESHPQYVAGGVGAPAGGANVGGAPAKAVGGRKKKPWWRRTWVLVVAGLVGILVVSAALSGGDDEGDEDRADSTSTSVGGTEPTSTADDGEQTTEPPPTTDDSPTAFPGASGDSDEVDDIESCALVGDDEVEIRLTNDSSGQSNYLIQVVFQDEAGQRLADEPFFVNHVRPGESVIERQFSFDRAGASCVVVEVDRISAESPDDISEVTCEVTGVDVLGDITARFVATNSSSGVSDYLIEAALVRQGVRIGTVSAVTENVAPGESAPTDGFTTTDGPAEGVICEPVYVERLSS